MHGARAGRPPDHGRRSRRGRAARAYLRTLFAILYGAVGVPNEDARGCTRRIHAPAGALSPDELGERARVLCLRLAGLTGAPGTEPDLPAIDFGRWRQVLTELVRLVEGDALDLRTKMHALMLLAEFVHRKPAPLLVDAHGEPVRPTRRPPKLTAEQRAKEVLRLLKHAVASRRAANPTVNVIRSAEKPLALLAARCVQKGS